MDLGLRGKVAACVRRTGGSKGIGKATALALAQEGADVSICARRVEDLDKQPWKYGLGRDAMSFLFERI